MNDQDEIRALKEMLQKTWAKQRELEAEVRGLKALLGIEHTAGEPLPDEEDPS